MSEKTLLGKMHDYPITSLEDGDCKGLMFDDAEIFVVKHDGQLFAYVNQCPHLGINLEWLEDQFLDVEKQFIHCSTHGALFMIDSGECVSGPCQGEFLQPIEIKQEGSDIAFYQ